MNKKWEYKNIDSSKAKKLQEEYSIGTILAKILVSKNITDKESIQKFLNPSRNDFYDSFLMPDMNKAVERIIKAMKKNEKICIYGDYDVDGITSVTVLKSYFEDRNIQVNYYIPNRLSEGYGLNKEAIKKISEQYKTSLIITVDCGITSIEEVQLAKELGIDVIITDHHEPAESLPKALAVIDTKREDYTYPFRELAGVGVAFKLIQALSKRLNLDAKEYLKYLDIVCIGTISDIVPLIDENRVITKLGLRLIKVTKNIGLKALIDETGYKEIDSEIISFGIAPRINACGRMGHEQEALNLFLEKDKEKAKQIALKLNEYNQERQKIEKRIFEEAKSQAEKMQNKQALVLAHENWHHGVIGIVSSKITEIYFKPSLLLCFENEEAKGSGRSVPGFDLHEALMNCSTYLERFGGHAMAVGLTLKKKNFVKFKEEFEKYAQNSNVCDIIPIINIDEEISLKEINIKTVEELNLLEPYGEANQKPIFLYKYLKIYSIRILSEGKHIKLILKNENFFIDAIGFNLGNLIKDYKINDKVDVVGNLEINKFNGYKKVQINIKDIRKSL